MVSIVKQLEEPVTTDPDVVGPLVPADAVDCETVVPADGVDCETVEEPVTTGPVVVGPLVTSG